ncbi:MAG: hypothetical protein AAFX40_04775, partial [Cyanobacteria bacterium J06639_1]
REVASTILNKKVTEAKQDKDFYGFYPEKDLYRSYLLDRTYHWGSNNIFVGFTRLPGHVHQIIRAIAPESEPQNCIPKPLLHRLRVSIRTDVLVSGQPSQCPRRFQQECEVTGGFPTTKRSL